LDQYLNGLAQSKVWALAGEAHPLYDAALARILDRPPRQQATCVLWGDPSPANILFDSSGGVMAALDWEAAALGPPELDLAWWFFLDDYFSAGMSLPRLEGLPSKAAAISIYAASSGTPVVDLAYYELIANLRFALLFARSANLLKAAGRLSPGNQAATHNPAARMLAAKLGLAAPEVGADVQELFQAASARH
jgi:aminoglycoside phosphotransferase (APT) family kinase protein